MKVCKNGMNILIILERINKIISNTKDREKLVL